jgi:hypothetical protein
MAEGIGSELSAPFLGDRIVDGDASAKRRWSERRTCRHSLARAKRARVRESRHPALKRSPVRRRVLLTSVGPVALGVAFRPEATVAPPEEAAYIQELGEKHRPAGSGMMNMTL